MIFLTIFHQSVIIGDDERINKAVGANLAVCLEINFLDFDGYCEYINCVNREDVCMTQGKRPQGQVFAKTQCLQKIHCRDVQF